MKLKNKILTTLAACLFSYSVANAQISASSFNKGTFYYGLEYYNYHEIEDGHDPFMRIATHPWPTVVVGYSDYSNIRSNSKLEYPFIYFLEGSYGKNRYSQYTGVGATNRTETKVQTDISYVFPYNIYLGLGYRYLYDAGNTFRDRRNQLWYLPVGYGLKLNDGSNAKLQFNYLIKGTQVSYWSQELPGASDVTMKQKHGWGLDLSYVPVESQWEIYTKFWNIENSPWTPYYLYKGNLYKFQEPHNFTYEIGFKHTF